MDNRIRIAIIEDEALIAEEIRRALTGLGYEVSDICYDFVSGTAAIRRGEADLFLLDINLGGRPEENGIGLAALLRAEHGKAFIFLTAYSDKDTIRRATALHPANYLIKPVNPAALFAAIQLAFAQGEQPMGTAASDAVPDFFYIKLGGRKEKLYWRDVYGMEAGKNYVRLMIRGQSAEYPLRGTIAFVLDQLVPEPLRDSFFRLGRSVCLNRRFVTTITSDHILCGGRKFENGGRIAPDQFAGQ